MKKLLTTSIVTTILSMGAASASPSEVTLVFNNITSNHTKGWTYFDYQLTKNSWQRLRRLGIKLRAEVASGSRNNARYLYSFDVTQRNGRLWLPPKMNLRPGTYHRLTFVGAAKEWRVGGVRSKGDRRSTNHFAWSGGNHGNHGGNHGGKRLRDQQAVIKACGAATTFNSEFQACVQLAKGLRIGSGATIIRACDQATTFDSEFKKCLRQVTPHARNNTANLIGACKASTTFQSEFTSCLAITLPKARRGTPQLVRTCKKSTTFNSDFKKCLQAL